MPRTLRRDRCGVLEKCFGRAAGEGAELGDEMRLIGEPALERELGPGHRPRKRARTLEPDESRGGFRRYTDVLPELGDEPLPAPVELFGERADACSPVRSAEPLPCPDDRRRCRRRIPEAARKDDVEVRARPLATAFRSPRRLLVPPIAGDVAA